MKCFSFAPILLGMRRSTGPQMNKRLKTGKAVAARRPLWKRLGLSHCTMFRDRPSPTPELIQFDSKWISTP
jgi:hypothetical protein